MAERRIRLRPRAGSFSGAVIRHRLHDLVEGRASRAGQDAAASHSFCHGHGDRACATGGVPGPVPHALRHTAVRLAIATGANVKVVQSMLGHAKADMTFDLHGHLFGDELNTVADRMHAVRADILLTEHRQRADMVGAREAIAADQRVSRCPRQDSNLRHTV